MGGHVTEEDSRVDVIYKVSETFWGVLKVGREVILIEE